MQTVQENLEPTLFLAGGSQVALSNVLHILLERKYVREDANVGDNGTKHMLYTIFNVAAYACVLSDTFLSKSIYDLTLPSTHGNRLTIFLSLRICGD